MPRLDGGNLVFGRVLEGMSTVSAIAQVGHGVHLVLILALLSGLCRAVAEETEVASRPSHGMFDQHGGWAVNLHAFDGFAGAHLQALGALKTAQRVCTDVGQAVGQAGAGTCDLGTAVPRQTCHATR